MSLIPRNRGLIPRNIVGNFNYKDVDNVDLGVQMIIVIKRRISLEAMVSSGYSFLIGLFKPSTYGGLIPLLL